MTVSYTQYRVNQNELLIITKYVLKKIFYEAIVEYINNDANIYWHESSGTVVTESYQFGNGTGYRISTDNGRAWALEYGTGEYADTANNPDWQSYQESEFWNPYRRSKTIVTRDGTSETTRTYPSWNWDTGLVTQRTVQHNRKGGIKIRFQGEAPQPQIDKMMNDIERIVSDKLANEGYSMLMHEIQKNYDRIFIAEKEEMG